jgi:oligopeptide/dipeptide ABC transporter ATP-binding protein
MMCNSLLTVRNLVTHFYTYRGVVKALDGVNLTIGRSEFVGLVGETGSGKSVTALSIMRLIESPGKIISGEVMFEDKDLLKLNIEEMRRVRGKEISMIFQEPTLALNPVLTIGLQLQEAIETKGIQKGEAEKLAINMLEKVGLPDPERIFKSYPHELSGGMAQRAMIAMALSLKPKLLIADEPTSSLDVTVQAQITDLMKKLVEQIGTSVLYITHNLGVAADICDKIAVMYAGNIVEFSDVLTIFEKPLHPYTQNLLKAIPKLDFDLYTIEGEVPDLVNPPSGCRFHPRCQMALDICRKEKPKPVEVKNGHFVACHLLKCE